MSRLFLFYCVVIVSVCNAAATLMSQLGINKVSIHLSILYTAAVVGLVYTIISIVVVVVEIWKLVTVT